MDSIQNHLASAIDIEKAIKRQRRFWGKVDTSRNCWEWQGAKDPNGYGYVSVNGRRQLAHRHVFTLIGQVIPAGKIIDHKCHNTSCVRPAHLRIVTHKQNMEHRVGAHRNSRTGVRGVSWHQHAGMWQARLGHNGKSVSVGYFEDIKDAEIAVIAKRNELFTHNDADRMGDAA